VAELAAAGRPALLVPFPYAADDHQRHNARAVEAAGAGRMIEDAEMTGERLFQEVSQLAADTERWKQMAKAAREQGKPGAGARAAGVMEEEAKRRVDKRNESRNNNK
jgi:UDP-N-acetylglucosamine--N-acetylmuramyl-(pentapeptide) pyrophosphoryl-undecaprenol N-acetylglucosamine transferase